MTPVSTVSPPLSPPVAPVLAPPAAGHAGHAGGHAGAIERIVRSPGRLCLATLLITVLGLGLDRHASLGQQALLGLATWGFLAVALVYLTPMERAQTAVVVVVATCAEVLGSVMLGIYEYRLGNLPLFVPPGHGLVYLTGLRLSQAAWVRRHARAFVRAAIAGVLGWALLGLVLLPRLDVAGAVGALVLTGFLLRGRAPAVYAGVFVAVAFLEIYGTVLGTWTWAHEIPVIGVPDGNPPSGAASGYVLFDIAALALAPRLLAGAARLRGALGRGQPEPARCASAAAAWPSRDTPESVTSVGHSGAGAPASAGGAVTTARQRVTLTSQPTSAKSSVRSCSRSGGPTSR